MKISKSWTIILVIAAVIAAGVFILNRASLTKRSENKIQVTATFYTVAEFARQVGGKHVEVTTLTKPGLEPHEYDPTASDIAKIYKSSVLVYNGAGLEPWIPKLEQDLQKAGIMLADTSTGISLRTKDPDGEDKNSTDPHIWLDPQLAILQVGNVRKALIAADPANAYDYAGGAIDYTKKLQALDEEFKAGLANCKTKTLITSHESLSYLAARYGLNAIGIAGLSTEDEPSPQKLAEIADYAKQNNVSYILTETTSSSKLSKTIAQEAGVQTLEFNPLEGLSSKDIKAGKNYISVQKDNLRSLQTALQCTQ